MGWKPLQCGLQCACFVLAAWAAGLVVAQAAPHTRVELISRQTALRPGSDLQLGIHFTLEPGWHIYWINPGDSGQPPSLKWQLPPGFSAGEIQWPRPERMQATPELADYGYHDETLLMVPIHAPPLINNEQLRGLKFAVEAKWLVCREVCIPEHANLELFLHSGAIRLSAAGRPMSHKALATLAADSITDRLRQLGPETTSGRAAPFSASAMVRASSCISSGRFDTPGAAGLTS